MLFIIYTSNDVKFIDGLRKEKILLKKLKDSNIQIVATKALYPKKDKWIISPKYSYCPSIRN